LLIQHLTLNNVYHTIYLTSFVNEEGTNEFMSKLDENGNEIVASTEDELEHAAAVVNPPVVEPVTTIKKLELTPEELDEIKREAVASAQAEQEERIRREEAERQGNYKALFEQAEADRKEANLQLWRQKALNKFKLSEDLESTLVGDTEEELMKVAKKLRASIDREVEAKLQAETVPPPDPGRVTPPRQRNQNAEDRVRQNIKTALNIGRVLH
jgi:hypothetical protein